MTIVYDPKTITDFSITVGIGSAEPQQKITLYASEFDKVATQGLHFELPQGVHVKVGSLKELIGWLNDRLKSADVDVTIPDSTSTDWPQVIQNIFNGILNTVVKITVFTVDQEKKDADGNYPPLKFDLEVSATAMDPADPSVPLPIELIPGLFSVVGGGIVVRRSIPSGSSGPDALPASTTAPPAGKT